jgi:class 3 adenylate cyclase
MKSLNFIHRRPILTISVLSVFGLAAILSNMAYLSNSIKKDLALKYADSYLIALNTFHSLYSTEIIERVKGKGVEISSNYKNIPDAIPFPVTFSIELANKIAETESGVTTRLYSNYPFATRMNGGPIDKYESMSLNHFQSTQAKNQAYIRYEKLKGQDTLRFSRALIMKESCVNCHNKHPDSTKRDWTVGDVRGVRVVNIPLNLSNDLEQDGWVMTLAVMVAMVSIGLAFIFIIIQALRSSVRTLSLTNSSYGRFVPHEFLSHLNKKSIIDVNLNDNVEKQMTILFSDIRSFTSLSEGMTPKENFQFINDYLGLMGPIIRNNHGFIDKYIGDAIMALFENTDDAINASLQMLEALNKYNRENIGLLPHELNIGIGIHRGHLRLGTIGEAGRMDGTVISDAVNLASRIESTTKVFGSQCLISKSALNDIDSKKQLDARWVGEIKVKGKENSVSLYEVYNGDSESSHSSKKLTYEIFEEAVRLYQMGSYDQAQGLFTECIEKSPSDKATEYYLTLCRKRIN